MSIKNVTFYPDLLDVEKRISDFLVKEHKSNAHVIDQQLYHETVNSKYFPLNFELPSI